MADVRVSQGQVLAPVVSDLNARIGQAQVFGIIRFPTENVRIGQAQVMVPVVSDLAVRISQAVVMAIVRGRVDSPAVRTWTYTIDQHDYYVLRLGSAGETLVYDFYSGQWSVYGTGTGDPWRAYTGGNWQGGRRLKPDWSDVGVGDDANGALYFLSPDDDTDDDPNQGDAAPQAFRRRVTGQVVLKPGYSVTPCFGVQLFGSIGADAGTVNLAVSDDRGNSYTDAGDLTTVAGEYGARLDWRSLGSMSAPGRLFRITDTGALKRIDALDMPE